MNVELIIIGAGATGLMAACRAAELHIPTILIERKHQAGRKLLMCGNNRCNLTSALSTTEMLSRYGDPVSEFLTPALNFCNSEQLRQWFHKHNLPTKVHKDDRVFPRSEKASDVLYCFTDLLREANVPILYQAPVTSIKKTHDQLFDVAIGDIHLTSRYVLIATGGVSYPKTGSVGDGQKWGKSLGHSLQPYRPGLVGFELNEPWLRPQQKDIAFTGTKMKVFSQQCLLGETSGEILCSRNMATGPAFLNASRLISRTQAKNISFIVDLYPQLSEEVLSEKLQKALRAAPTIHQAISSGWLPPEIAKDFIRTFTKLNPDTASKNPQQDAQAITKALKHWKIIPGPMRSLKEAIVTIGGISLEEVDPTTMMSRCCDRLYFAGEVLDIDGPSGGFNLQAAFSTALLAINDMAQKISLLDKREKSGNQKKSKK